MQEFPKSLFCTLRAVVRFVILGGVVSVSVPASLGNAQIAPDMPNPIVAPNPLTRTLSIFRLNMQDKIDFTLQIIEKMRVVCQQSALVILLMPRHETVTDDGAPV